VRKKLAGSILVVGGSSEFSRLRETLKERLSTIMPPAWELERVEVVSPVRKEKEVSPGDLSWRGGAIMAHLPSAKDMWIPRSLWLLHPDQALKERAPFIW
jgi:actin-related protein